MLYIESHAAALRRTAHGAIGAGFASAAEWYGAQKKEFYQRYQEAMGKAFEGDFVEQFNQELEEDLNKSDDYLREQNKAYNDIVEALRAITRDKINKTEEFAALRKKFDDKLKETQGDRKKLRSKMDAEIDRFLSQTETLNKTKLLSTLDLSFSSNEDIQNNLYGYARRVIFNYLSSQRYKTGFSYYRRSLAGYYQEEILTRCAMRVLDQYANDTGHVRATPVASVTNEKGQQIQIDIAIIGGRGNSIKGKEEIENLVLGLEGSYAASESMNLDEEQFFAGIQSKRWALPWSENSSNLNTEWLSFGSHSNILASISEEDQHYWHAGVIAAMNNIISIIGKYNFLFATGNQLYWTADLVSQLKQHGYVLAFRYSQSAGHLDGAHVYAMQDAD